MRLPTVHSVQVKSINLLGRALHAARLGGGRDPAAEEAMARAAEHVRTGYPDLSVTDASLRATEPSRYVFAVYYRDPSILDIPRRYKLIAVARRDGAVEELEASPHSPYWIRNRK